MSVVAATGCIDDGSTDGAAELEGSPPVVPSPPVSATMAGTTSSIFTVATDRVRPTTDATTDTVDAAVGSSATAASVTSGDDGDDAAAAAFTHDRFQVVPGTDPGCTVAVGRNGEVVFADAYGAARLDPFEPMTVDTVVDIGSVSKQFTATALLLLSERGMVDLDAPVATYLPDLPAWGLRPTLTQLIHHQSGIPDHLNLLLDRGASLTGPSTIADALAALGDVTDLDFAPGTLWQYSNSNYFLLSQVVLAVTGQDLGSFLAAEVFGPLGLDMVMDPTLVSEDEAVSYERVDGEWVVAATRWESTIGAGSVHTTPSQLVMWAAQYWAPTIGAPTINTERLAAAVVTEMGRRYGAGIVELDVEDVGPVLAHDGSWNGFVTDFVVAPAHRVAVAITCTSEKSRRQLPLSFATTLLAEWIGSN